MSEDIVVRVLAEVDDAERKIAAYRSTAERCFGQAAAAARGSSEAQRAAYRDVGRGVSAFATDMIAGKDAFVSLSQHGIETAAALEKFGGTIGKVGSVLSVPSGIVAPSEAAAITALREAAAASAAACGEIDVDKLGWMDPERLEAVARVGARLSNDLAQGLADAIVSGKSLGDVLVDSFARAGAALLQSKITQLFDPTGDGSSGLLGGLTSAFGVLAGALKLPGRASGGSVSAGKLYRVNEFGIEGFRPAGSGSIVPLGRMAARPAGGGVTVVQPLNVSFAGAITTPELMAQFKAYADGVGQAAAIGGAAMAQARLRKQATRSLPR